jgi:hypothetical protein
MLSGLDNLSVNELVVLENYLQIPLGQSQIKGSGNLFSDRVLDLLEGLWYAQALKERQFDMWVTSLIRKHSSDVRII